MSRIMIVEDNLVATLELEELLLEIGYDVVGTAESASEAISKVADVKPDLILMDIKLPGKTDGISVARNIKTKMNIPIVFLTGHSEPKIVERASRVHPQGFVLKPYHGGQIRAAIEVALKNHEKEELLERNSKLSRNHVLTKDFSDAVTARIPDISVSELSVAGYVKEGLRTKEIADALGLSRHTVSWHRNNIRKKMGLDQRNDNLMSALRNLTR